MISDAPMVDWPLLRLIEDVLRDEGYEVVTVGSDDGLLPMVLAENNYFMAAATAVATLNDLALAEPHLVSRLAEVTASEAAGPKRWDAYAVLLTQQEPAGNESDAKRLFELAYDTAVARRIVQAGVRLDVRSVRRAIVPFVEPPNLVAYDLATEPLDQLREELVRMGASLELVDRAIDVYRAGGSVSDVF
jgi:hypothetical protein